MPLSRDAFIRYRIIDARLRKKPYPTLPVLQDIISQKTGIDIGTRTLQKDIEDMRYNQALGFNAPIVFDRRDYTYKYSDPNFSINNLPVSADELHGLDFAVSILNQFKHLPAIKEFEDAIKRITGTIEYNKAALGEHDYIQMDKRMAIRGIEHVQPLLAAITDKRRVKLEYQRYDKEQSNEFLLDPYLIKEYKNFWYVVGNSTGSRGSKTLTFALDRIVKLTVTREEFTPPSLDKSKFFKNVLGVSITEGEPEKIELSFTPVQGKYIKTAPIHHTQKILKDKRTELRVQLHVVVNYELISQILSYGASVRVVKPASLIDKVKQEAGKMMGLYK
jgi:predicted DNA-binding transcriptional regulator YafY